MLYGVPQYIDVEDKVAGPLTAKQVGWLFALGAILTVLWKTLDKAAFFTIAIPLALAFAALAFIKPHGRSLISFVFDGILFVFRPKFYTWQRLKQKKISKNTPVHHQQDHRSQEKRVNMEDITTVSQVMDSRGRARSKRIEEILKQRNDI